MVEKHRDRVLHDVRPSQDGVRDPVGSSIQLIVSERMRGGPDGDSSRILGDLLFETIGDGLVDLFLLELDKCACRMEALVPDCPLLWREVRDSVAGVIHCYRCASGSTGEQAENGARGGRAAEAKHKWKGQGSDRPVNLRQSTGRFGSALPDRIMLDHGPANIGGLPILL
jgi:hypothetical protein